MIIRILLSGLLLLTTSTLLSQNITLSKNAKVSIITCDKGAELYSLYGHTALRISDASIPIDIIFNYGAFDFSTPNFYLKFIKGDLQYFVTTNNYDDFLSQYTLENRAVFEQELLLSHLQKQELFNNLNASLFTEDRFYTYKYIDRNCTTMVMDKVNEVLKTEKIPTQRNTNLTYREILYKYQKSLFFENLGINIIFGTLVDHNGSKIFLPKDLMIALDKEPLLSKKAVAVNEVHLIQNTSPSWNSIYIFAGLILLVTLFSRNKIVMLTFLIVMGLMGLFFSVVGLYSFHKEILWNYNIMLFNPLFLVLTVFITQNKQLASKKIAVLCLMILALYTVFLFTKVHLLLVLPLIIPTMIILIRLIYINKKVIF